MLLLSFQKFYCYSHWSGGLRNIFKILFSKQQLENSYLHYAFFKTKYLGIGTYILIVSMTKYVFTLQKQKKTHQNCIFSCFNKHAKIFIMYYHFWRDQCAQYDVIWRMPANGAAMPLPFSSWQLFPSFFRVGQVPSRGAQSPATAVGATAAAATTCAARHGRRCGANAGAQQPHCAAAATCRSKIQM